MTSKEKAIIFGCAAVLLLSYVFDIRQGYSLVAGSLLYLAYDNFIKK